MFYKPLHNIAVSTHQESELIGKEFGESSH